jgi:site-specific recombinase XerD
MYACGLRIGEATTLEIRSIDRANQVLRIIGKGDKERLVLLPQPVLDELGTLWRTHRNPRLAVSQPVRGWAAQPTRAVAHLRRRR